MSTTKLRLVDPTNPYGSADYDLDEGPTIIPVMDGVIAIDHPDGSVTFEDGNNKAKGDAGDPNDFYRNLADDMDAADLAHIANELLTGIQADIDSRKEWMETRAAGIRLLGLKIEEPRGDAGTSSAPLEGMSTIHHPLLLEATIRFQATARGELLPASGPVKVRNDLPMRPDVTPPAPPAPAAPGAPPPQPPLAEQQLMDELGNALEKDMNHFLTVTATEYVPDTDRMLFYVGFGGDGFKKVYNHPLKRRPMSESVDAEDMIISDAAIDIRSCGRFTHRIKMRPSMLKRLQIAGYYREVDLAPPNPMPELNAVDREKAEIAGQQPRAKLPKDADYEIYECYCEQDLDEFAPKQFKGKELALPFIVTIDKNSRQILAVRRNWAEDDEQALTKQFFVQFPFIRGLTFSGLGLVHLLGNITLTLTAIWREMLDAGMFANFPGFLFAKAAGRQNINQIRVPPGGGFPVDVPPGMTIQQAFMAIPYKEPGPAFTAFAQHVEEVGQRLGMTADTQVGEGKQDVPVGTTMALIEQATKVIDSVHKRMHAAQAEEFGLLKERFKEDPEAFWRHNKKPARQWQVEEFVQALNERELVPVADPNNPTSLHRIAKATIIDALVSKYPQDMDHRASLKRILRTADIDADGLLQQQTAPPPPDPRMMAIQAKAQAEQMKAQIDQTRVQIEAASAQMKFQDAQQERAFKAQMQNFEIYLEKLRVQAEMIIHAHDMQRDNAKAQSDIQTKQVQAAHGLITDHIGAQADQQQAAQAHQAELARGGQVHAQDIVMQQHKHMMELARQREEHAQELQLEREKHQANLENQRKIAEAKAEAMGPHEDERAQREAEQHGQSMQTNEAKLKMQGEKHKADLANDKKLTDAKAKAMSKPKPSGEK